MSLLNLSNVPGGMISGANSEELNWIVQQSNERILNELDPSFLHMLDDVDQSIVADISPDLDEQLNNLEKSLASKSTKDQESLYVNKFRKFLLENSLCETFESVPFTILNNYLRFFYSKLEKNDGLAYTPSTLVCIRSSIQRYLESKNVCVDIRKDKLFTKANNVLKKKASLFLSDKSAKIESYPAIEVNDLSKIYAYFDRSTPEKLLREVWFSITYHLGLRGREAQRHLTLDSLVINTDSDGKRYVGLAHDFITKNTKASQALNRNDFETIRQARMYELKDKEKEQKCPVEAFELYLSKLSTTKNISVLFRKSLRNPKTDEPWYSEIVLGKNTLGSMMKTISKDAGLSKTYTNHSIRVTTVNVLKEAGYTNDKIQSVTGHRNEASVSRYCRKRRDVQIRSTSEDLQFGFSNSTNMNVLEGTVNKRVMIDNLTESDAAKPIVLNFSGTFHNCSFNTN